MNSRNKIVSLPTLLKKLPALRKEGKRIAFTNGCFDLLHLGHVRYLEKAKQKNRVLVVGLNSDKSVRKIKGKTRPIVDERARAEILAAMTCVDYIVLFDEETPLKLISAVLPDILIKGADYKGKYVAGEEVIKSSGGKMEHIAFIDGYSSTKMIRKILRTN